MGNLCRIDADPLALGQNDAIYAQSLVALAGIVKINCNISWWFYSIFLPVGLQLSLAFIGAKSAEIDKRLLMLSIVQQAQQLSIDGEARCAIVDGEARCAIIDN